MCFQPSLRISQRGLLKISAASARHRLRARAAQAEAEVAPLRSTFWHVSLIRKHYRESGRGHRSPPSRSDPRLCIRVRCQRHRVDKPEVSRRTSGGVRLAKTSTAIAVSGSGTTRAVAILKRAIPSKTAPNKGDTARRSVRLGCSRGPSLAATPSSLCDLGGEPNSPMYAIPMESYGLIKAPNSMHAPSPVGAYGIQKSTSS